MGVPRYANLLDDYESVIQPGFEFEVSSLNVNAEDSRPLHCGQTNRILDSMKDIFHLLGKEAIE